jgi:hypothetical protein
LQKKVANDHLIGGGKRMAPLQLLTVDKGSVGTPKIDKIPRTIAFLNDLGVPL